MYDVGLCALLRSTHNRVETVGLGSKAGAQKPSPTSLDRRLQALVPRNHIARWPKAMRRTLRPTDFPLNDAC